MNLSGIGLGSRLRSLLAMLDGDVQQVYDALEVPFRPRFFPVVRILARGGPAGVSAIAQAASVSQPAMTQTINEMKRLGLVSMTVGADRRERAVSLTAAGWGLTVRLKPVWRAVEAAAEALERELSAPLAALLDETIRALDAHPFAARIAEQLDHLGADHA